MDVDLPRGSELRQLPGAASRTADGEVSHILGPLFAEAEGAQLVARPERAVEEDAVGAVEDLAHRLRQGAHAGHVREDAPGPLVDDPNADVVFLIRRHEPFEVHGRFSGHRHGLHDAPALTAVDAEQLLAPAGLEGPPRHLAREALERAIEHILLGEADADALGRVDEQRVGFPQREEPQAVVQVTVREQERLNRRLTTVARMKRRKALDLCPDLRRGVQENPAPAVRADRHRFLASRHGGERPFADPTAVRTATVPLREPAPGRRAQYPDQHEPPGNGPALPAATREGPGETMTPARS